MPVHQDSSPQPEGLIKRLSGWLSMQREERLAQRERAATLAQAIEEVISGTEPKLRALGHYDRTLKPVVEATLDYIEDLIDRLPPPIELSRAAWSQDHRINAFFASTVDLRLVLSRVKELQDFFRARPGAIEAFAILTSVREERQTFGISLEEDMLRRDVAQTSVAFVEPRLLSPSATEAEVRQEAKHCALRLFIHLARKRLEHLQARREGLAEERRMLETRLHGLRAGSRSQEPAEERERQIALAEAALAANGREMADLCQPGERLGRMLEQVRTLFADPRDQITLAPVSLYLDRLGIKHPTGDTAQAPELSLLECTTHASRKVITLVRCPRSELMTAEELAAQASPYLAGDLGFHLAI